MSFKKRLEEWMNSPDTLDVYSAGTMRAARAGAVVALRLAADDMDATEAKFAAMPGQERIIVAGALIAESEKLRTLATEIEEAGRG